jgi:Domain of unknown function (DUF1857)
VGSLQEVFVFALSATIVVNPPDSEHKLTRSNVWRGLVMKAENPLEFVPSMEACQILERFEGGLVREILARGERWVERITFTPEVQVRFDRIDAAGHPAGWITNVLSDSALGLLLTFTFAVVIPGVDPGSEAERARGESMRASYVSAIEKTLATVRTYVCDGRIPSSSEVS